MRGFPQCLNAVVLGALEMLQIKRKMAITNQEDEYNKWVSVTLEENASASDSSYQNQGYRRSKSRSYERGIDVA